MAVARRPPPHPVGRSSFEAADIVRDDLVPLLRGADAVVHLAWLIQPGRDEALLELIAGTRAGTEFHTPPFARETGGPVRIPDRPRRTTLTSRAAGEAPEREWRLAEPERGGETSLGLGTFG